MGVWSFAALIVYFNVPNKPSSIATFCRDNVSDGVNSDIWNCKWRLWLFFYKIVDQRIGTYILILSNFLNKKSNWLSGKHLAEPVVSLRKSLRFEFFSRLFGEQLSLKKWQINRVSMFLVAFKVNSFWIWAHSICLLYCQFDFHISIAQPPLF